MALRTSPAKSLTSGSLVIEDPDEILKFLSRYSPYLGLTLEERYSPFAWPTLEEKLQDGMCVYSAVVRAPEQHELCELRLFTTEKLPITSEPRVIECTGDMCRLWNADVICYGCNCDDESARIPTSEVQIADLSSPEYIVGIGEADRRGEVIITMVDRLEVLRYVQI